MTRKSPFINHPNIGRYAVYWITDQPVSDWLTDALELRNSSEASSYSATQELPNILYKPKVHHHGRKNPILSHINPVHTTPSYSTKIHHNITFSPMSISL
jgi:hypothetical protein